MRATRTLAIVCLCLALAGCRGMRPFSSVERVRKAPDLPAPNMLPAGQLVFHSDFTLPGGHRLVRELAAERDDICQTLGLPTSDEPIHVYLFRDAQTYSDCVERDFPSIPPRRAFFIETDTRLAVYAHWSDRVAEDLRHEVAHGYLHSVVPGLPLWLDEGLAEYFEVPRGQGGLNRPHVELLADLAQHNGWRPDLNRLEHLTDIAQMDQQSYAEAWAWVYYMLESGPDGRALLTNYLFDLRSRRGAAETLSARIRTQQSESADRLALFLNGIERK